MTAAEINEAVRKVWKTELTKEGIDNAVDEARKCCGVGCERCTWELAWIIQQLLKQK